MFKKSFSIGTIPERIIPAGELLFVLLPGQNGSLIFGPFGKKNSNGRYPNVSANPIGSYSRAGKPIARIGDQDLPLTLDAFPLLYPEHTDKLTAVLKANGRIAAKFYLLGSGGDPGASFWLNYSAGTTGGIAWVCTTWPDSDKTACYNIRFPADGFWTVLAPDGRILRNCFEDNSIRIYKYGIPE